MFARHVARSSRLALARPSLRLASHIPPRQPYAKITPSSLQSLAQLVGSPSQIVSSIAAEGIQPVEQEELDSYNEDWMGKYKGKSGVVVKPKTAQEVGAIVRAASPSTFVRDVSTGSRLARLLLLQLLCSCTMSIADSSRSGDRLALTHRRKGPLIWAGGGSGAR